MIYADSSFLVSLYLRDTNSEAARHEIASRSQGIGLSRIAQLEVQNAFRLAVFRKWITPPMQQRVQAVFESDLRDGFLCPLPFTVDEVFAEAESLSKAHTASSGNRSPDVLHIACARLSDLKVFASFDERQRSLGKVVGLSLAPENP